jgi:acyl-CoA synthetase (AMP-forming)/AMP-acid ligase II
MPIEHRTWYIRYSIHLLEGRQDPGVRFLNPTPISFAFSRNLSLVRLLTGGTVLFMPPLYSADELAEKFLSTGADFTALVPTVVRDLLNLAENEKRVLFPSLNMLHCGGASISAGEKHLVRQHLCSNLFVGYGTSGTGRISVQSGKELDLFPESVGKPYNVVLVQIVDEEDCPLPPGEIGAIRVRSPGNVTEIYGSEGKLNGEGDDRVSNGWVYPGDIGSLNQEGYLTLHGRRSNVIIRGGANVYPAELEAVLNSHPAIKDSAVVGQPSRSLGEEVVAFVVTDGSVAQQDLLAFCRSQFSADKRPRALFMMDSLPRSSSGKILHRELAATLEERD